MLQSMTGFGKATANFKNKKITVEIKSLNSKNLDLFVRIPHIYKSKEIELRKLIGDQLDRGKVECIINIESNGEKSNTVINKAVVANYYEQLTAIKSALNLKDDNLLEIITKMPDVFSTAEEEVDEGEWQALYDLTKIALVNLVDFRLQEGKLLADEFSMRISNIESSFNAVPNFEAARIDGIKERIESNLEEFVGLAKVDKNRFEQELIYYIEKIDIAEEKLRLNGHLNYFREILAEPKSQGKKLGFIVQEIGREINTLGSKSYHAEMQKLVVEMKDELEKIKEQILNTL
ncbi:YicC family protein [Putridiphycobacter roseus]|uniref:YicC family protein n=1 Tax=Putridiphycobacter roseus TaxID=2219161 RepID=A0A2W1MWZ4_9FLAO|nr:YicC/YloC family endoribonuclease [Putridiphycobacter roseus]PZE16649.1 YicC family protein [Putridiphycobacter roseus]